ncbi:MAG: glycosyltransferase [Methanobrevibacter sp.]|jgi:glycosyltransferase involved in cell wall biosynthesis|nr:glycosyltransferase [Candidatus Methanovirga meridionalis]
MNNIKISVIIPVYNVENTLKKCLDSVINQTLYNIEIICVNDGSTDNSLGILEKYESMDSRIKIITKINEGLGAARKTGLDIASGEYIFFVDSDDCIVIDALKKIYENGINNNSDVVMLDLLEYNEKDKKLNKNGDDIYNVALYLDDEEIDFNNFSFTINEIKFFLLNRGFGAYTKCYKHSFLKKYNDFYFPKHIIFEDMFFHVQVLLRANRISFCPYRLYIYRLFNENSILNTVNKSMKIFNIFDAIDNIENFLIKNKQMNNYKIEFELYVIEQLKQYVPKVSKQYSSEFFAKTEKYLAKLNLSKSELSKVSTYHSKSYEDIIKAIQKQ